MSPSTPSPPSSAVSGNIQVITDPYRKCNTRHSITIVRDEAWSEIDFRGSTQRLHKPISTDVKAAKSSKVYWNPKDMDFEFVNMRIVSSHYDRGVERDIDRAQANYSRILLVEIMSTSICMHISRQGIGRL